MTSYVREQSVGSIFRTSFKIYKNNFLPLIMHYFLLVFPFTLIDQWARIHHSPGVEASASILSGLAAMLAFPFITVAVSEICLGNRASVKHSWQRVRSKSMGGFIKTYLLVMLILVVGLIMLVIPGIVFAAWYLFTLQVVVLESLYGTSAMKRSKELGKGFYWRNLGIILLLYMVMLAAYLLIALVLGGAIGVMVGLLFPAAVGSTALYMSYSVIDSALLTVLSPFPAIGLVLLYYDMRARKECYDSTTLAEDLMR